VRDGPYVTGRRYGARDAGENEEKTMEMSSTRVVPAPVEATWEALNDPAFLKDCIPGCESIEKTGDNQYKVVMAAKVGPVNARFNGRMTLSDLDPPRSYSMAFEGQGGAAGFAKGTAHVVLAPSATGTDMTYRVAAQVGGKLAQIGSRLVDGAAKKVADDFFGAFVTRIGERYGVAPAGALEPAAAEAAAGAEVGAPVTGSAATETVSGAEEAGRPAFTRNKVLLWAILIIIALVLWILTRQ
jgi:carbon monoxide dehydrogenase subunit G